MKAARPYADELTRALAALGTNATVSHPMLTGVENPRRTGILVITSDRGLAGGYSANAIKAANELAAQVREQGREPIRYVIGRKGAAYYNFRRIELAGTWTGFSEQPNFADARGATETLVSALQATSEQESGGLAGIDELYVVYTRFESMVTQVASAVQISPVKVDEVPTEVQSGDAEDSGPQPMYDFEPEPGELLKALLPRYISARIFSALLESAASESAARRRAMKSASDNAGELIKTYTRLANQARQAEITQEISEIVGGADALASAGSDQ
jgi:F-type H+-transporting ATPase subunit gamma